MMMINKNSKNNYTLLCTCSDEIAEAMTLYKNGNSKEAIAKFKKALELSKVYESLSSQVIVYQILGTCQRLSKDHDAAWTTFVEGWNLIETLDTQTIISDMCFMFYAYEMLRVEFNVREKRKYHERFNLLWGKGWEAEIFDHTNV